MMATDDGNSSEGEMEVVLVMVIATVLHAANGSAAISICNIYIINRNNK